LKVIRITEEASTEAVERFLQGAKRAAKLKQPNIVPIHDTGREGDLVYLTMSYIKGATLDEWLRRREHKYSDRVQLLIKICRVVHEAHKSNIVHRDIKPRNIIVDDHDEPHLIDFDLSKDLIVDRSMTIPGHILGTAKYMAPEQAKGHSGSHSDIWSLGVILYEALTDRVPFSGESVLQILDAVKNNEPVPPRRIDPSIPRDLETVCLKCLEKPVTRRIASAEELADELQRWQEGRPIRTQPVGPYGHFSRWCKRNPVAAILAFTAAALMLTGGLLWMESAQRRKVEKERVIEQVAQRKEILRSSEYVAVLVASILHNRLEELRKMVDEAGGSPELSSLLMAHYTDGLNGYLKRFAESRIGSEGYYPFKTSAIFDPNGIMLAHSHTPRLIGESFSHRDYMKGALRLAKERGGAPVYISRIYRSESESLFKFGIPRVVRTKGGTGDVIGVILAAITTSRTMGMPHIEDQRYVIVLVGRGDMNPAPGKQAPPKYMIVLHPSYPEAEQLEPDRGPGSPVAFPEDRLAVLTGGQFEDYQDPVGKRDPDYRGRWLVGSAPVKDTEFVVIVQVKYDEAL
jgi:serine/threonine-protein kinase